MSEKINAPVVLAEPMATPQLDDGSAQYLRGLSSMFLGVADKAYRHQVENDIKEAKEQGLLIGQAEGVRFQPIRKQGYFYDEFNKTALHHAGAKAEIEMRNNLFKIYNDTAGDPDAFMKRAQKYYDGRTKDMAPEMHTQFDQSFNTVTRGYLGKAMEEQRKVQAQEAKAQHLLMAQTFQNNAELMAQDMLAGGEAGQAAAEAVAMDRKRFVEHMINNGPRGEFEVAGMRVPADPNRSEAFEVDEIMDEVLEYDRLIISSALVGQFMREAEADRGVQFYTDFINGNIEINELDVDGNLSRTNVNDVLLQDDIDKTAERMRQHIGFMNQQEDREYKLTERFRKEKNRNLEILARNTVEEGELKVMYSMAKTDDDIEQETLDSIATQIDLMGMGAGVYDPSAYGQAVTDIRSGEITRRSQLPRSMSREEYNEALTLLDNMEDKNHWQNSTRYKMAEQMLRFNLFKEYVPGMQIFNDADKEKVAKLNQANEMLLREGLQSEQLGSMPESFPARQDGEWDPVVAAERIIKNFEVEKINEAEQAKQRKISDTRDAIRALERIQNRTKKEQRDLDDLRNELNNLKNEGNTNE